MRDDLTPWIDFNTDGPMPAERRYVLVAIPACSPNAPCVMMGYLRYAAGDLMCPYFVTPGGPPGAPVPTHWNDCLGDDYRPPGFENSAKQHGFPAFTTDRLRAARDLQFSMQHAKPLPDMGTR